MKKSLCCAALLLGAATGCVTLPVGWPGKADTPPAQASAPARPSEPVSADDVNETNARQKLQALREELDREENPAPPPVEKDHK